MTGKMQTPSQHGERGHQPRRPSSAHRAMGINPSPSRPTRRKRRSTMLTMALTRTRHRTMGPKTFSCQTQPRCPSRKPPSTSTGCTDERNEPGDVSLESQFDAFGERLNYRSADAGRAKEKEKDTVPSGPTTTPSPTCRARGRATASTRAEKATVAVRIRRTVRAMSCDATLATVTNTLRHAALRKAQAKDNGRARVALPLSRVWPCTRRLR